MLFNGANETRRSMRNSRILLLAFVMLFALSACQPVAARQLAARL
jgi:hypothetical protein